MMSQCDECGAIGAHFRGCDVGTSRTHGIGERRITRSAAERERFYVTAEAKKVWQRKCARCEGRIEHVHHITPVADGQKHHWSWFEIDAWDNLVGLCWLCHQWVHAGVNYDKATEAGWLTRI